MEKVFQLITENFLIYLKKTKDENDHMTLPYVYNTNNFNEDDSQDDLVYFLVNGKEVIGEVHYYLGLQYKYG
jgi:hypothetical protein